MEQILVCLKKNRLVNIDILESRRKELVALSNAILAGNLHSIAKLVEKALDVGASRDDILKFVAYIVGNERIFSSIIELFKVLDYEENRRAECISVVDDVREEI